MKITFKLKDKPYAAGLFDKVNITLSLDKAYIQEAEYIAELRPDTFYTMEVKKVADKKTMSQHRYCWALINTLAQGRSNDETKFTPTEVYKEMVRDFYTHFPNKVPSLVADDFKRMWESKGIGWFAEKLNETDTEVEFILYYGLSEWNKDQCTEFIHLLQDELTAENIPYERELF